MAYISAIRARRRIARLALVSRLDNRREKCNVSKERCCLPVKSFEITRCFAEANEASSGAVVAAKASIKPQQSLRHNNQMAK